MKRLLQLIFSRYLIRFIGLNIRYAFFKIIGNFKSSMELSNKFDDHYSDMGNAVNQDFLNTIIGAIGILFIALILLLLF